MLNFLTDLQKYAFSIWLRESARADCRVTTIYFPTGDHWESQLVSSWPAVPSGLGIRSSWLWGGLPSAAPPYSCHPTPAAGGRWWCCCQCHGPTGVYSVPSPGSAPFRFYEDQPTRNEVTVFIVLIHLCTSLYSLRSKFFSLHHLWNFLFWVGSYLVYFQVYFQLWAVGIRQCQERNEPGFSASKSLLTAP